MVQERVECIHCKELIVVGANVCPHCKLEQTSINKQGAVGLLYKAARIYLIFVVLGIVVGIVGYFYVRDKQATAMAEMQARQAAVQQQMAKEDQAVAQQQAAARKQIDDAQRKFYAAQKKSEADMKKAQEDAQMRFDQARQNQGVGGQ